MHYSHESADLYTSFTVTSARSSAHLTWKLKAPLQCVFDSTSKGGYPDHASIAAELPVLAERQAAFHFGRALVKG